MATSELTHHGVKGMKWGVRKDRKWASSKHQPSSVKSSILAGLYAATRNKTIAKALDKSNDNDAKRWKLAKERIKKLDSKTSASVRSDSAKRAQQLTRLWFMSEQGRVAMQTQMNMHTNSMF